MNIDNLPEDLERNLSLTINNLPAAAESYVMHAANRYALTTMTTYLQHDLEFFEYLKENEPGTFHGEISDWGLSTLKKVTQKMVRGYIDHYIEERGDADEEKVNQTIRHRLYAIGSFFRYYEANALILNNPTTGIAIPKYEIREKMDQLSKEEEQAFLKILTCEESEVVGSAYEGQPERLIRDQIICLLILKCGLSPNEMVPLNIENIEMTTHAIRIRRKGKGLTIYMPNSVDQKMKQYLSTLDRGSGSLFASVRGGKRSGRLSVTQIRRIVKGMQDLSDHNFGREITARLLRATCIGNLIEATNDITMVKELIGYKSIQAIEMYDKVDRNVSRNFIRTIQD